MQKSKPIKILRIINRFNIGGPTYNVSYLSKFLSNDFETLLVGGIPDEGEEDSIYIPNSLGLHPKVIPMERSIGIKNDYQAYKAIRLIIQEFKPDIVHTHASKAGALGRLAAKKENVPVIIHTFHGHVFHSYFGKFKTFVFKKIEQYLAKNSTYIIAISEEQKKELSEIHKICKPEKIKVVKLGFDLNRFTEDQFQKRNDFRTKYQVNKSEIAISIIGRLAPIKDHELFIKGVEKLHEKHNVKNIRIFIIGDGDERESIEKITRQLPSELKKKITFTSWIKNIDEAISGVDLVVLTSLNEGTPVSLIEAQAGERAVISTNVGGVKDVVINNKTGLICEGRSSEELAEKMALLCKDSELRKKMGQKGRKWALENFSYQRLCREMEEVYKSCLG